MPARYEIKESGNLLQVTYSGRVEPRDTLDLLDVLESGGHLNPGFLELSDLSAVTDIAVVPSQINQLVRLTAGVYARNKPPSRIAFVAPARPIAAPLGVYVELLDQRLKTTTVRLFGDAGSAMAFLRSGDTGGGPFEEKCAPRKMC